MKCYKDIFDAKIYKKNTGMFIVLILMFIQIICIIAFYCKSSIKIRTYIASITDRLLSYLSLHKNNSNIITYAMKSKDIISSAPPKKKLNSHVAVSKKGNERKVENKIINKKSKKVAFQTESNNKKTRKGNMSNKYNPKGTSYSSKELNQNTRENFIKAFENSINKKKEYEPFMPDFQNNININIEDYIKTEPDYMYYYDAIKKDKRTFCKYFWDRIKIEQIILSIFLKHEALKPIPIKIIILIFNIDLYLIINGLFFSENYLSDLLYAKNETKWSFINRIFDRIAIIIIVVIIINYIFEFFFIKENEIKKILKGEKESMVELKYEIVQVINNINKRYNIFIIISSVILLFSLYYIFTFNNVYPCIKTEWLKSSLVIFCIMQIITIILCFINSSLRFISFKCKSERLFRLSSILL